MTSNTGKRFDTAGSVGFLRPDGGGVAIGVIPPQSPVRVEGWVG